MANRIVRYMNWVGVGTRIFNVGNYRRQNIGAGQSANFFSSGNTDALKQRNDLAQMAINDMFAWLSHPKNRVAVFDATNTTKDRRALILEECHKHGVTITFIESICRDPAIIEANVRETKVSSPDYVGVSPEQAVADFRKRIAEYEKQYETIDSSEEDSLRFMKIIDVGGQVILNRIDDYLGRQVSFFLSGMHIVPRPIWLVMHGETEFGEQGRIGGDSDLTATGRCFAERLAELARKRFSNCETQPVVWHSHLLRDRNTAKPLPFKKLTLRTLNDMDVGDCEGMTYAEIASKMQDDYAARVADKLMYRFPRGESYEDLIQRVEPVVVELERQKGPIIIVASKAVLRVLCAYFLDKESIDTPYLFFPTHRVVEIIPKAYGNEERVLNVMEESTNETSRADCEL